MTRKDDYIVSAWRELCSPAITIIPSTNIEPVVQLSKEEIQPKSIRVDFSLEDMDKSGFQKAPTYKEIKAYVKAHTAVWHRPSISCR